MRNRLYRRVAWGVVVGVAWALAVSAAWAQDPRSPSEASPAPQASAQTLQSGNAERGAALYLADGCWACHGYTGATGSAPPLALTGLTASSFVSYLRSPRTTRMPLYSTKVMSDEAALDLYAYIKTFKRPLDVEDIPLLQQIIDEN